MPRPRTKPPVSDGTEFLSVRTVAEMVDVAELSVRRWISSGLLPAYYVGPLVRIRRADLDTFLRPVAVTAPSPTRRKARVTR